MQNSMFVGYNYFIQSKSGPIQMKSITTSGSGCWQVSIENNQYKPISLHPLYSSLSYLLLCFCSVFLCFHLNFSSIMGSSSGPTTQMGEDEACSFAMTITSGSVPPMVLKAVIELDVLEIIKRAGPGAHLSPAEIAAQLPTKNPDAATMLDRMLRLLASYSILSYSLQTRPDGRVERLYGLAPVCQFLTKNDDGVTLSALALMNQDKILMESWYFYFLFFFC